MIFKTIFISLLISMPVFAGSVEDVCAKSGLEVITLNRRDRNKNIDIIKRKNLGNSKLAKFLKDFYLKSAVQNENLAAKAIDANKLFIKHNKEKELFLRFSSEKQKILNPEEYRKAVSSSLEKFLPTEVNKVNWLLLLKDNLVHKTFLRPASADEEFAEFGAVARIVDLGNGKFDLGIIYSNNDSEPIPYLIPLIAHEFEHLISYKEKTKIKDKKKYLEYQIVEEAKAFDLQMRTYVAIAKQWPDLFCNWMYVTWSYGDLLVPLSWTMASMERDMAAGDYIFKYTQFGPYKGQDYLLNPSGTALRADLQIRIDALNLKYIK